MEAISDILKKERTMTLTSVCDKCTDGVIGDGLVYDSAYLCTRKRYCSCELGQEKLKEEVNSEKKLAERKQNKIETILTNKKLAGVSGVFHNHFVRDIEIDSFKSIAEAYVERWGEMSENGWGLFLHGGVGCGKTFMASAIANELLIKVNNVLFRNFPVMVGEWKKNMEGDDGVKSLMMCDLLVLDDMGIEKRSEWLIEKLYQIIDYRWKMKKPMIVTSNIPLDKFDETYSPQIKSRIYGMCKNIYMGEEDLRKKPNFTL